MVVPMAKPAASSLAELTRLPVESFSMALFIERELLASAVCALSALMLVLIAGMVFSKK